MNSRKYKIVTNCVLVASILIFYGICIFLGENKVESSQVLKILYCNFASVVIWLSFITNDIYEKKIEDEKTHQNK
ncbi:MAG: hypothetical protein DBY14_01945 [Escherichia coli]|nr:MAG: hypothetical protein DBY14_01945 [Escherichia coli]